MEPMTQQLQDLNTLLSFGEGFMDQFKSQVGEAFAARQIQVVKEEFIKPAGLVMDDWEIALALQLLYGQGELIDPDTLDETTASGQTLKKVAALQHFYYFRDMQWEQEEFEAEVSDEDYNSALSELQDS